MKTITLCLIALAVLGALGAGCTTGPGANNTTGNATPTPDPALLGTWQLVSFLGADGGTVAAIAGSTPLVTFDREGRLGGTAGCNHFSADYTASGSTLTVGPVVSTLMYCSLPAGVMDQEQRVFALFPMTGGYTVSGNSLFLSDRSGNRIMSFERAAAPTPAPLVGTTWQLSGFSDRNGTARSVLAGTNATLVFAPDGTLRGDTGCNIIQGPYTQTGSSLSLGPLAVTERACADPAMMVQERDLLEALGVATTYDVQGDRLRIANASGGPTAEFRRLA